MEYFNELKELLEKEEKIKELIKRISSIQLDDRSGQPKTIFLKDSHYDRYTFATIAEIIGKEKLISIIEQFKGLIAVELYNNHQKMTEEISNYSIIHKS